MKSSSYPQNNGIKLEMDLYKRLNDLRLFDNIIMEKDLIRLYGWDTSSIDHLLFYGNYIIPIQTKWVKTKRRETHAVNNFLKSVKIIQRLFGRPILFGIWCSRMTPFEDNQELMKKMNILSVSCFEDMEILIDKTIEVVMKYMKNV
jgi:hypothetical protein